jgi:putative YhdH/YhfP family quinone oxidoreductase
MRALLITENESDFQAQVADVTTEATDASDLKIKVEYSSINFKDTMVAVPKSRVRRAPRLIGGVDAAGEVVESSDPNFPVGSKVEVHGDGLGVSRDGGFAEFIYAPSRLATILPSNISTKDSQVLGTAGITAAQSILALENHGIKVHGDVLITGSTGGVGSIAVTLLAKRGYKPVASTGSPQESQWLLDQGAVRIIGRDEVSDKPDRVLGSELWDGAIDCVGGETLGHILRSLKYGAAVAASGLLGGVDIPATVYPFITRNVGLLGIDSVEASPQTRAAAWKLISEANLDVSTLIDRVVTLEELPEALDAVAKGATRGRVLVVPN